MKKDDTVYLRHILDAIGLIKQYTRGMSENQFLGNSMAHDAVVRQIEIIGEAARNISDEFQEKVGSSRVDLQACKLEYSIVSPK